MNHKLHRPLFVSMALLLAGCTGLAPNPVDNTPVPDATGSGGRQSPPASSGGSGGPSSSPGGAGGGTTPAAGGSSGTGAGGSSNSGGSGGRGPGSGGAGGGSPGTGGGSGSDASMADQGPGDEVGPPPGPKLSPTGPACPAGPFGDPLPVDRTATLIKAVGSLEGPVWVEKQNALFFCVVSGTPKGGRIDKYTPAGNTFATFASGIDVAGLALSPKGTTIIAASFDSRNMTEFDLTTAKRTSIAGSDMYMGKPFDQTNDVVVRSDGNIYFTDTDYRQDTRPGQETTAYYRLSPEGKVTRIGSGSEPNGIALSPDGRSLYVSSTGGDPLRRYTLDDAGAAVGPPTTFSPLSSDGMTVDCAGNVYLSNNGSIKVLAPDGKMLGTITGVGGATVSNAAFGGPDYKTLFITTAAALYQIKLNVPGFPS